MKTNEQTEIPNPGSPEAIEQGCKCPRMDNANGKGYMGIEGMFVYSGGCLLHNPKPEEEAQP